MMKSQSKEFLWESLSREGRGRGASTLPHPFNPTIAPVNPIINTLGGFLGCLDHKVIQTEKLEESKTHHSLSSSLIRSLRLELWNCL